MKFEIIGKNVSITEAMRQKIEKKLSFLDKYLLIDPETRARVVVRTYPLTQKIEVTIPTKVGILRTEVEHEDLYAAIDLAIDKLEDQVRRQKTRLSRRHREKLALSFVEQDNVKLDQGDIAVRTKTVKAQRMDLEEAILRMEMLGHSFFIYTDEETDSIAVVYKPTKVGILRTEVEHEDLYAAIDLAIDKLEDQVRRQKTRLSRRHREKLALSFIEQDNVKLDQGDIAVRTKTVKAQRMDLEEAILRMEMLGHSFFIYTDEETDSIAVVYKRNSGGYGLLETEDEE